jgi:hypothetical protein
MPIDSNPFVSDPVKADVFEQGFAAGFMDPDSSDFRPLSADLLDAFQQGFRAGRTDRSAPPVAGVSSKWLLPTEVGTLHTNNELPEGLVHAIMIALFHGADHMFKDVASLPAGTVTPIPLIDLVMIALDIPGDTSLGELPPDFSREFNRAETDPKIHFIGLCPRQDHTQTSPGVTSVGYWTGQDRSGLFDAADDIAAHGHSEAFVARCDLNAGTCGAVWLAGSQ